MKHVVTQRQIPTVQFSCVSCLSEYEVEADLNSGEIEISKVVRLSSFRGVEDCIVHYESDCPVCGAVNESTQTEAKKAGDHIHVEVVGTNDHTKDTPLRDEHQD